MKHRHAEIIKAWADNQELLVLTTRYHKEWGLTNDPSWDVDLDYFLCLPKHKDAVLALLNGGTAQFKSSRGWPDCKVDCLGAWRADGWYMNSEMESCVRPKKQTRYAYASDCGDTTSNFSAIKELKEAYPLGEASAMFQLVTFEIEV
jgi:hypothetical protein